MTKSVIDLLMHAQPRLPLLHLLILVHRLQAMQKSSQAEQ